MKNKLFGNVGGNQFKLLTESVNETIQGANMVREGLKKVFTNGGGELSYDRLSNVGFGYIKDIMLAKKCALQEARYLAEEFGYRDDVENAKFVKEDSENGEFPTVGTRKDSPESDMSNPSESREVEIAREIIRYVNEITDIAELKSKILELANELVEMHGQK